MFYGIYFFQRYPAIDTIRISYVYVEHDDMENVLILERKYIDTYISQLNELIVNVETDDIWVKNKSKLCDYCDFRTHCNGDEEYK
jgi:CRISPR/Cas system-associated exonuclease Cas4 (RecB family)